MSTKNIKSKVNTGLSRSKSTIGGTLRKQQTDKKYKLDLSPNDRIRDDLERKFTAEQKNQIQG
jgi:hypothetical protein